MFFICCNGIRYIITAQPTSISISYSEEDKIQPRSEDLHSRHNVKKQNTSEESLTYISPQRMVVQNVTKFCDSFMLNTYSEPVPVCDESVECYGNTFTSDMIKCTLHNILLQQPPVHSADFSQWFNFLSRNRKSSNMCPNRTLQILSEAMQSVDYMYRIAAQMLRKSPVEMSKCSHLEQKVFFFFTTSPNTCLHFFEYHSLYKSIEDSGLRKGEYAIVRTSPSRYAVFDSFEKTLFPEVQSISCYLTPTCVKRAIFVPYYYYTVPFRCKIEGRLLKCCTQCTGEMYKKSYVSFRTKVLQSCGLSDSVTAVERRSSDVKSIVLVSRKPIDRKAPTSRIVVNEKQLVEAISQELPSANLTVVHMEELSICQQIEVAHKADVLMGPHGAGMIHLWWMQVDAVVLEFEPDHKVHHPTFRVLSALIGRTYKKVKLYKDPDVLHGRLINFTVNVDEVIAKLRKL